jgi:hypothetical protein
MLDPFRAIEYFQRRLGTQTADTLIDGVEGISLNFDRPPIHDAYIQATPR